MKKTVKAVSFEGKGNEACNTIAKEHFFVITIFLNNDTDVNGLYFSCSDKYKKLYKMLLGD